MYIMVTIVKTYMYLRSGLDEISKTAKERQNCILVGMSSIAVYEKLED